MLRSLKGMVSAYIRFSRTLNYTSQNSENVNVMLIYPAILFDAINKLQCNLPFFLVFYVSNIVSSRRVIAIMYLPEEPTLCHFYSLRPSFRRNIFKNKMLGYPSIAQNFSVNNKSLGRNEPINFTEGFAGIRHVTLIRTPEKETSIACTSSDRCL